MRLHYYRFPEEIEPQTRFQEGAVHLEGACAQGRDTCRGCTICADGWSECTQFIVSAAETSIGGISVKRAKELLRKYGGDAWTEHIERDGGVFEVTEIQLKGNNSRFRYNRHL